MTIPTSSVEQVIPGQGAVAQPEEVRPGKAKRRRFRFVANAKAVTGLVVLGIYILFAIIGPWVAPYDPDAQSDELVAPPSAAHWFGTTHLGQDVFSQILVGRATVWKFETLIIFFHCAFPPRSDQLSSCSHIS